MFNRRPFFVVSGLTPILTTAFVTCVALGSAAAAELRTVEVEGTEFKVTLTDGHVCVRRSWSAQH